MESIDQKWCKWINLKISSSIASVLNMIHRTIEPIKYIKTYVHSECNIYWRIWMSINFDLYMFICLLFVDERKKLVLFCWLLVVLTSILCDKYIQQMFVHICVRWDINTHPDTHAFLIFEPFFFVLYHFQFSNSNW